MAVQFFIKFLQFDSGFDDIFCVVIQVVVDTQKLKLYFKSDDRKVVDNKRLATVILDIFRVDTKK